MPRAEGDPLVAVLAAGLASRFGGGKLDAECAGKPLGRWALDAVAVAGFPPGVIIVGPRPPAFTCAAEGWTCLTNPAPEQGLGHSVAIACQQAQAQSRGVLLVLADMPLVTPDHLRDLCSGPSSAATVYPDKRAGVPAYIAPGDIGIFTSLGEDSGAAKLFPGLDTLALYDPAPSTLLDVDDARSLDEARQAIVAGGRA